MISIAEAISDLLYVRDTVVVPGLGAFVKKATSAKVNPVANHFTKPGSQLEFDANLREDNDLVVDYMAEKNEIPKDEAQKLLAMFVSDCFNSLKKGKKLVLKNIGTLYYDWASDLVFEQDKASNYNSDAFGLSDFSPTPVVRSMTKNEIKAEIEKQQMDKNTPMTVDEKAVHEGDEVEDDEEPRRSLAWLWALLGVVLLAAVGYGLYCFKVIDFGKWRSHPSQPIQFAPGTFKVPSYEKTWEWKEKEPVDEPIETPAPAVDSTCTIRIIAGCFGQEENAARLTNTLKAEGFGGAFYELSGSKWFVSFGRYATDEEATKVLREIRANTEYKAWIKK